MVVHVVARAAEGQQGEGGREGREEGGGPRCACPGPKWRWLALNLM